MHYRNGKYSVEVGSDGAIKVKHGDWLSKYSAAMFNTFWRVNEFGRISRVRLEPIKKVDLIYAGETIYHIPTYNIFKSLPVFPAPTDWLTLVKSVQVPPAPMGPTLSEAEKKEIIKKTLAHDFNLRGEQIHVMEKVLDIVHVGTTALELAEIAGLIHLSVPAATVAGLAGVVALPTLAAIEIYDAMQSGEKLAGFRAVAYTTTAWAFDDPIPGYPERLKANLRSFGMADKIPAHEKAWQESSRATLKNLGKTVEEKRVSKKSLKVVLRALGGDDRQVLCRTILKEFEKKARGSAEKARLQECEYPD